MFGHANVSVLDGGLTHWKYCQYPLETGPPQVSCPQPYTATFNPELVRSMEQVLHYLNSGEAQVGGYHCTIVASYIIMWDLMQMVDARSEGRFNGTDPEPRPSFPSGHMIGAKNVPFMKLINSETKLLRSKDELRRGL